MKKHRQKRVVPLNRKKGFHISFDCILGVGVYKVAKRILLLFIFGSWKIQRKCEKASRGSM